ncbi:MAG: diguanylate cyclase [Leptospiraceae bacterium]|nr:diguanylate cyclase [Leptospiraceae bacterium]MCP5497453.1 diguanylate cyclase [Leptospiraceae bacterium]
MKANQDIFDRFILSLEHKWIKIILILGIVLVPLFGFLDAVIMPREKLKLFLFLRFIVSGILIIQLLFLIKFQWNKYIKLHAFFFTFLVGTLISFMTTHLGGFESSYYAGLNLVLIAVNFFLPWGALDIIYNSLIVIASYLGLNLLTDLDWTLTSLINNMFFMSSTIIIAATIGHYKLKLIRSDFDSKIALKESEEKYKMIFNNSPMGIAHFDKTGVITTFNETLQKIINLPNVSEKPYNIMDHIKNNEFKTIFDEILKGTVGNFEGQLLNNFVESETFIRANLGPIISADGNVSGVIGVIEDISEKIKAEENIRLADKVFQNSNEAIMLANSKNEIIRINSAFSRVTGYSLEEVIGKQPSFLKNDLHDQDYYKKIWDSLIQNGEWRGEVWDRRKNGEVYPKWLSISIIKNENQEITHLIAIFTDISTLKQTEKNLERLAHYDSLTNLPNRILFRDRLQQAILHAKLNREQISLMFLDLDRFKMINDTLGHKAGDQLLFQVADRLTKCLLYEEDMAARLSGDEFTLVLKNVKNLEYVEYIAQEIQNAFSYPFLLENRETFVTMSIGVAVYPKDGVDLETLLKNADRAMYSAKKRGRNNYQFYSGDTSLN